MSWVQRVGKYSNYVARNYKLREPKDFSNKLLEKEINNIFKNPPEILSVIGGKKYNYGNSFKEHVSPAYSHKVIHKYKYFYNNGETYSKIINSHNNAKEYWAKVTPEYKFQIFERIADLVENKYFYKMMAATMVNQGKNKYEAELDCIAETVDFLRFNIQYASSIYQKQPISSTGEENYSQYRPLQGKVNAITPFNFTAIGANLSTAPLYFGNQVLWKPSEKSLLSNWVYYNICIEAGIPSEVLNFIIMEPTRYVNHIMKNDCGGILFTGSTQAFKNIIKTVNYDKMFPRIIGETGGKNFHFIESSANIKSAAHKTFESAFNYSGQKCSACSIVYVPENKVDNFMNHMEEKKKDFDYENYGVISEESYERVKQEIHDANKNKNLELIMGGNYSNEETYFIEPTVYKIIKDENIPMKTKELFAPILLVKPYDPKYTREEIIKCATNSDYKLTGAFFSEDRNAIDYASSDFENSCGNFYINDKSTGSVVGNQPFGGFGLSGTNDKAGDINMLYRLFNQRSIKMNRK